MKSTILVAVVIFAGLAVTSCYMPNGEYVNPIEPPDPTSYVINLFSFKDGDTIKIFGPTDFRFVDAEGNPFNGTVVLTLGNEVLPGPGVTFGAFGLDGPKFKSGVYDLTVRASTRSGTNSLADRRGKEQVEFTKKWVVKIFIDPPPKPEINLKVVNGYQVVSWTPYTSEYFTNYTLEVTQPGEQTARKVIITNKLTTSWVDSVYMGHGVVTYALTVTNKVGSSLTGIQDFGDFVYNPTYNKEDSTVTIELKPPKYRSLNHYVIKENSVERMRITDPNQATASFKLNSVGYGYKATIAIQRFLASEKPQEIEHFVDAGIVTKRLPRPIDKYFVNADLNAVYEYRVIGNETGRLVRYDLDTLIPVDSVDIFNGLSLDIPYRGSHAYFSRNNQIVQLDLSNGAEKTYSPSINAIGPSYITAGSNESVSFTYVEPGASGQRLVYQTIYNMASGATIYSDQRALNQSRDVEGHLSDDGRFYRSNQSTFYKVDAGMQLIGVNQGPWKAFREDKSDEFFMLDGDLRVYDTNTLTLKRTITGPSNGFYWSYDAPANKAIYGSPDKVYVVDIETNQTMSFNATNLLTFRVINGTVITGTGEYFKVY